MQQQPLQCVQQQPLCSSSPSSVCIRAQPCPHAMPPRLVLAWLRLSPGEYSLQLPMDACMAYCSGVVSSCAQSAPRARGLMTAWPCMRSQWRTSHARTTHACMCNLACVYGHVCTACIHGIK